MIRRTYSVSEVNDGIGDMAEEIGSRFNTVDWLLEDKNIALINDVGDVGLFEAHGSPGVYYGHYFFKSRGKNAVSAAREFLQEVYGSYGIQRIMGYTPVDKLGAMWLTRHLGFTPLDVVHINDRDHQVWTMHRKDFIDV